MMNWKRFERKRSWSVLRYYPDICLDGLRKTTKYLNLHSRFAGKYLKPGSSEYETRVLTSGPQRSVFMSLM
jgi:hypothetical protein